MLYLQTVSRSHPAQHPANSHSALFRVQGIKLLWFIHRMLQKTPHLLTLARRKYLCLSCLPNITHVSPEPQHMEPGFFQPLKVEVREQWLGKPSNSARAQYLEREGLGEMWLKHANTVDSTPFQMSQPEMSHYLPQGGCFHLDSERNICIR